MILDPFAGSSTTGIAANMLGRKFVGIEQDSGFLKMSKARRILLDEKCDEWAKKIPDLRALGQNVDIVSNIRQTEFLKGKYRNVVQ